MVPNLQELSSIDSRKAIYVGPLKNHREIIGANDRVRDTILCYPGVSGIDPDTLAAMLVGMRGAEDMRIVVVRPGPPERRGRNNFV